MNEWVTVPGYGQPAWQLIADAVVGSIRGGNLSGGVECRVSPRAWEAILMQFGGNRPVEVERCENRVALMTFSCGRKVKVLADETIEGPDEVRYRAIP